MDKFLNDKKIADALGIHRVTLWRWSREGKFPKPVKLTNGSTRWKESEILNWQKQMEIIE